MSTDVSVSKRRVPSLTYGYGTDRGLKRELNEDSLIASDPVFAVADGMGGHEAGEVASGICVRTLGDSPVVGTRCPQFSAADIHDLLQLADQRIREATGGRAGTTVSGVMLVEESESPYWLFFNVGDSRTYRLSQGVFEQVTVDHSEVQELVDIGRITEAEAQIHPRRHVVTRALGTGSETEPDFWLMPVEEGDRIMVCSDGLTGEVSAEHIRDLLSNIGDPQMTTDSLIDAALRSGARDNVSVIVIDASGIDRDPAITARTDDDSEDTIPRRPSTPKVSSADQPTESGTASNDAGDRR
ncbi:PP2C family protein-serine/threonine phosphatase [Arthrobacter roseus]|uniref:PP2C family protein-serine/threonine phosphatase n=1 Tax=Arthrobacter roseus TaxID=136274 RepID=UPI0019644762|nr:protein phosphatase 2C domain-containing protein [Arthrobacter roseus]MBM7848077.1 protein phosphatase [Arthrobacter roseus]